ncbi:hypothetical protein ACFVXW_31390 [Streptomyces sp. NPDC058251]|uniref:hypothetical protein n=1 Tax=Streptomyces sp. NPDC058251 TaxID=3346404 RepID=UPI0036EC2E81
MGRHSLPDEYGVGAADPRPRGRRRNVAVATVLVLTVAAGTAAAVRGDLFSFGASCQDHAVRLEIAASPDVAPALRATAEHARRNNITSDGRCLDIGVTARESYKFTDTLRSGKGSDGVQVWVPDSDVWVRRVAADSAATSSYAKGKFNALVLLTDGVNQDPGSISRSELVAPLQKLTDPERPVPLIAIAVGPDADKEEAEQIAKATGGSGHQVNDPAQIHSVILKAIVEAGSRG